MFFNFQFPFFPFLALIVQMFMPPSFDENQIVKYPLLIQVSQLLIRRKQ